MRLGLDQGQETGGVPPDERVAELVEENNRLRKQMYRLEGELEDYRVQLAAGQGGGAEGTGGHALRWQVGDVVVRGLSRPGWDTIRLPDRLIRLLWNARRQRRDRVG